MNCRSLCSALPGSLFSNNYLIVEVLDFKYFGSYYYNAYKGNDFKEIKRRLGMAAKKLKRTTRLSKVSDEATKLKFLKSQI